jgi:hypothetical protein
VWTKASRTYAKKFERPTSTCVWTKASRTYAKKFERPTCVWTKASRTYAKNRIDRLTLAVLGVGGGVIVALISLAGILAIQLIRSG